jgi:predicted protein tyrosine phosphatase
MNPAPIKIVSRYDFEHMDLDGYPFAISIREADEMEIPRPSYSGKRLSLSFYDLTEGPGIATADDVRAVRSFAEKWVAAVQAGELQAGLVVHCFAGISRSSAVALIPLLLYYQDELTAARRLFEVNRWADPNTHVVYLIEESFQLGGDLFTALEEAKCGMLVFDGTDRRLSRIIRKKVWDCQREL